MGEGTQWWHHQVLAGFLEEVVSGKQTQQARAWFSRQSGKKDNFVSGTDCGLEQEAFPGAWEN